MNFGNNKALLFLIASSLILFFFSYSKQPKYNNELLKKLNNYNYRFIAHAGGGIENQTYTNSIEAVTKSINNGFKLIEIDLNETSDNFFIGVHNWSFFKKITNYRETSNKQLTFSEIKNLRVNKKYKPITINEINIIFSKNKDLYLVTDKTNNFEKINSDFNFDKNRILVEIFGKKNLKKAIKKGIINPIYNYNSGDFNFIIRNNIKIITASINDILKNQKDFEKLINKNVFVFAYTSSNTNFINEHLGKLFTHIYTDFWDINLKRCSQNGIICSTY